MHVSRIHNARLEVAVPALDGTILVRDAAIVVVRRHPVVQDERLVELDPIRGTTDAASLIGDAGSVLLLTPQELTVAAVVAVDMWATRQRRPSAAACPQHCPAERP